MPTKYPPLLALSEAVNVIKSMYSEHQTREISVDLMPSILRAKPTSSGFPMRISALQRFGFVEKRPNDLLWLTDLAMQIINPIGNEANEAKLMAFKKIDVLSDLLSKYPNGKLPSAEQLQQTLLKTYQIERDRVKQWYEFVVDSFKAIADSLAGVLSQTTPSPELRKAIREGEASPNYEFNIPTESGAIIKISIPKIVTAKDIKRMLALISAMFTEEK